MVSSKVIGYVKIALTTILIAVGVLCVPVDTQAKPKEKKSRRKAKIENQNDRQLVRTVLQVKGGKATSYQFKIDTTHNDSITRDMLLDSTLRDSLLNKRVLPPVDSMAQMADSVSSAEGSDSLAVVNDKHWKEFEEKETKFNFLKDTISPTAHFFVSLVPGLGQIYNGQWKKAPIFIGMLGGFMAGGAVYSGKYKDYKTEWQDAVNRKLPSEVTDPIHHKMKQAGTMRTIFYSAAALTYLYQLADATFKYRGYINPVRKSTILAAIFPGAGFFYTRTYWRIPIYYGGFAVAATVVDYNSRHFQRYRDAYNALTDGDPTTIDEFRGRYSAQALANARDSYRRDRDFGIICMVGIYALSIIDTYVTATLKNWDVSPNLTVSVEPVIFRDYAYTKYGGVPSGSGLSMKLKF